MHRIAKRARRRPKALVSRRSGRLCDPSEGVEKLCRCAASPAASLLPDGPPGRSLWVIINAPWYNLTKPNGAFANTAPSVSKRRLGEAGQDLLALVLQFRDTAAAKLSSFAILERVLRDQFEIVDDECGDRDAKRAAIRDPKDVPCDTVGNPADPDASYNAHKGQGYMAQIVETYCEDDSNEAVAATPDLITHVEVHKMTVHDGHRLADALDDLSERALTPAVMLGDSHYGSSDNMALTREQNINLVAPARPPKGAVSGRLTLEDFHSQRRRLGLALSQ